MDDRLLKRLAEALEILENQDRKVHWLRKIVPAGEEEESDRDCIIRHGLDPDDSGAEYNFIVRRILPSPHFAEERERLAEVPAPVAPPEPATQPVAPVAPPPKPKQAPAVDPFEAQLHEAVAKIGGYRRAQKSVNRR